MSHDRRLDFMERATDGKGCWTHDPLHEQRIVRYAERYANGLDIWTGAPLSADVADHLDRVHRHKANVKAKLIRTEHAKAQ